MPILDTDHMSLLERGGAEAIKIRARLRTIPAGDVATTIVTYEEQVRGRLARIAQATTLPRQIAAYDELNRQLRTYRVITVLDFDERAAEAFDRLRQAKVRIGTMDLKIAAIALVNNAAVLTRNLRDFSKVPGLHVEDWSL